MDSESFKSDNSKSLKRKNSLQMDNEKRARRARPPLNSLRRQKIQFFTRQTLGNQSSVYGAPGSDRWINGVVKFVNYSSVTSDVVKFWIAREPSLIEINQNRAGVTLRSDTRKISSSESRHTDIVNLSSRTSSNQPSYPTSWYDFFESISNQDLQELFFDNASDSGISDASTIIVLPPHNDVIATDTNVPVENVNQHNLKTDDIPQEILEEGSCPELQAEDMCQNLQSEDIFQLVETQDGKQEMQYDVYQQNQLDANQQIQYDVNQQMQPDVNQQMQPDANQMLLEDIDRVITLLGLGDCLLFSLLKACVDTSDLELGLDVVQNLEGLFNDILNRLWEIIYTGDISGGFHPPAYFRN